MLTIRQEVVPSGQRYTRGLRSIVSIGAGLISISELELDCSVTSDELEGTFADETGTRY